MSGGWIDHVHLLLKLKTTHYIADIMRELKANTSKHFNETSGLLLKFGWQDGYGAFSVSTSQKEHVIRYIDNQEAHHSRESLQTEYVRRLQLHEVEYDPDFLWD